MVRIGIIGDYDSKHHTHVAINVAIEHTATALGEDLHAVWLPTPDVARADGDRLLSIFEALWATPASPYRSGEGMLRGIEYARTHDVPFTGT